ncbi:CPBP family intramembrane glutamic endopeptidase [Oleiphilus sp. HI0117]|uniref:CPBP family intramembrane glutamic endopeptidase n=4 Tax=unclassified Oleiphilus TaxID=2631174 RepID=UPI0007C31034|nr:CPBP family intramembrane glutamic endopeptidase [Oleiphilus sp. HI0117]KZY48406.1 hypothetical protein A3732_05875 [Oleiphilus sp. HI0050]KZZ37336.1 hypothetical protein A3757_11720 [Oleiphilus sp. HI0117]
MDIQLPLELLPSFSVYTLLISLLLKPGKPPSLGLSLPLFVILLITSWQTQVIDWRTAAFLVFATLIISQVQSKHLPIKTFAWIFLSLVPLMLALHLVPGFTKTTVFGPALLGNSSIPYTLSAHLDKALGAVFILFCFRYWVSNRSPSNLKNETNIKPELFAKVGFAMFGIFLIGYILGVNTDFKFGQLTFAFIFINLFVTCIAEEAFFRLIIQRFIFLKSSTASAAIIGSSLLFTLAHFHTGPGAIERLSLIFAAGLLYAWSYQRSNSLLLAILLHFSINLIHFSFFVYPASFTH